MKLRWLFLYLSKRKRLRVVVGAVLLLLFLVAYAVFLWTIPPARVSIIVSIQSEFLRFRVVNPELATLRLGGMRALTGDPEFDRCIDAVVIPQNGARLEYRRGDEKYFRITIDPPSDGAPALMLHENGSEARVLFQSVIFEATDGCSGQNPSRLPIWGPAQFGDILRPPRQDGRTVPGTLISGKLSVYGRAHDRLLGLSFPPSIYLVNSFELPPGSVLSAPGEDATGAWIGIASVDKSSSGLLIHAESEVSRVALRVTGTTVGPREIDQPLELASYAQFLNDPNIIKIQFLVTAFLVLFRLLQAIMAQLDATFFGPRRQQ